MNLNQPQPPRDASEEIPSLIETLRETEQRLEELTAGTVDTVAGRNGRAFLLRRAQEQFRHSEAGREAAILNALPAHIALLDAYGMIISVNEAWRRFAIANGFPAPGQGIGLNYLDVCDRAQGEPSSEARLAAAGIRQVLRGEAREFAIEYPCHSPTTQRWFLLTVTPLAEDHRNGAVVMHVNITERKQAEAALRRTEELYRRAISGAGAVPYSNNFKTHAPIFMGAGIEQLIGYAPHEINGALWGRIIQKSVMLGEAAGLDKAEAARRVLAGESRHWRCDMCVTTRDGRTRWISDASVQDCDEQGLPLISIGILQDITERKQAEAVAVAFAKLGRDLNCAASRGEAARIISEIANDLLGWDACSIQMYSEQDDTVRSILEVDTIDGQRAWTKEGEPRNATELHHRILKSGAQLILREGDSFQSGGIAFGNESRPSASLMYVPIRTGPKLVGILSIQSYSLNAYTEQSLRTLQALADQGAGALERVRAEEERRESESQFRLVWDTSADGMRLTDRDGTVLRVNEAYCRMVEKARAEIEGQSLAVTQGPERAEQVVRDHRAQLDSASEQSHVEAEVTLWNGRKVWFELSNSILKLPGHPPPAPGHFPRHHRTQAGGG